jgi:hypothetical protein
MYRHYSPRSTSSSDGRLPLSFVRSDGVFPTFRTSVRVGSGFEVPRHCFSGFDAFSDYRGFYYCLPPRHGGSCFDALWHGGPGFDTNLGEDVQFDGRLHDRGFDYSSPLHGYGGYGFEERGSRFDGNLGGGFGFDGRVPNRGINYLPTRHGHGGSGFTAPRRGDSGFDAYFGGGPGFDGLNDEQHIQYSTYWRGGGGFDSPRLDPCSRRAGPFPFLTAAGVPLDAGEDDSTCCWAGIPLDAARISPLAVGPISHWMPAIMSPLAIGPVSLWMPTRITPLVAGPVSHWMLARTKLPVFGWIPLTLDEKMLLRIS